MLDLIFNEDCLTGMAKIADKSIDLILCDLPYGTTRNKWDSIIPLVPLWEHYERIIKDNGAIVLTSAQPFTSVLISSNLKLFKYEWIWRKSQATGFLNTKKQPLRAHESICVFYKKQCAYNPQWGRGKPYRNVSSGERNKGNYNKFKDNITQSDGRRYPISVLQFNNDKAKFHPTQKPVALFEYLIKTYSDEGQTVLDNTFGSGTTLVAARRTNQPFIGFELNSEFCAIAEARLAALTKEDHHGASNQIS